MIKINTMKLIHAISKYDYISFGFLVSEAEQILNIEKIEKELEN